jgi:hypothetical protein
MTDIDDVYRERQHLVSNLSAKHPSGLVSSVDEDGVTWPIVYIELPTGQVSWHISDVDLDLFSHVPYRDIKWDGHNTSEKYRRLDAYTQSLVKENNND